MSFDHDPFRHIELIQDEDPHLWFWHCQSCGADGREREPLSRADRLGRSFFDHVRTSHGLTPEALRDKGWSKY